MPLGPTAEHFAPVSITGEHLVPLHELGVAHRVCQQSQGGRMRHRGRLHIVPPRGGGEDDEEAALPLPAAPAPSPRRPIVDDDLPEPKYFSDPHPDAVHSLAGEWADWLRTSMGTELRPWQMRCLERALEIDSDGRLCWAEIIVSSPRQVGKSWLIKSVAAARCHFADRFGEPQECLHVANNIAAARRIHEKSWRWARDEKLKVYRAFGDERITWPDGSVWAIASTKAIWGWTASIALADEAWDIEPAVIEAALLPVLVEREQSQLWLLSTANRDCTALMMNHRGRAIRGDSRRAMIAEWGAPDGSDVRDPAVWRAASPHWSPQREALIRDSLGANGFAEQWLNIWPTSAYGGLWAEEWPKQPMTKPGDFEGQQLVGAVEASGDRASYGVAVARTEEYGRRTFVEAAVVSTEVEALAWLLKRRPFALITGSWMADRMDGPWHLHRATSQDTHRATPWLTGALRTGRVPHNHAVEVQRQMEHAVVSAAEGGPVLSARRSTGAIPSCKAVAWAGAAAAEDWFGLSRAVGIY